MLTKCLINYIQGSQQGICKNRGLQRCIQHKYIFGMKIGMNINNLISII